MRDRVLILAGLIAFLVAVTYPSWRARWGEAAASPRASAAARRQAPVLARAARGPLCVLPVAEMRSSHMKLLTDWRDLAVRQGIRTVTMPDGRKWRASLTRTCLDCHEDKAQFCDRCHDYAGVAPECWNCHVAPGAGTSRSPGGPGIGAVGEGALAPGRQGGSR